MDEVAEQVHLGGGGNMYKLVVEGALCVCGGYMYESVVKGAPCA